MNRLFRTLLFYTGLMASTLVLGIAAVGVSYLPGGSDKAHYCGRLWGKINLWLAGVKVFIQGFENIDPDRSYIYAANHQGWFDIFAILGKLPVQFRWIAKAELFRIPVLGRAMSASGYIPIDRTDRRKAFQSIDQAALRVRNGTSILIFPEGTRSPDGIMRDFKSGGFILAIKSGQPILPLSISGSYRILPRGGTWLIHPGIIRISIGEAISTESVATRNREELMSRVREAILRGLTPEEGGTHTKANSTKLEGKF